MLTTIDEKNRIEAKRLFKKFPKGMTLHEIKYSYLAFLYEKFGGNRQKTMRVASCSRTAMNTMIEEDTTITVEPLKAGRPPVERNR